MLKTLEPLITIQQAKPHGNECHPDLVSPSPHAAASPHAAFTPCPHLNPHIPIHRIGLCRICHADVYAMVIAGEITWDGLHEDMGLRGIGEKLKYLVELDGELKGERAAELVDDLQATIEGTAV